MVQVTVSKLNIRAGKGTKYKVVGTTKKPAKFEILEKSGSWGRTSKGWIYLPYTKKI